MSYVWKFQRTVTVVMLHWDVMILNTSVRSYAATVLQWTGIIHDVVHSQSVRSTCTLQLYTVSVKNHAITTTMSLYLHT